MKNLELNSRFLIHSNVEEIQDDVSTDQGVQEDDLLVGDLLLETNMIKEKRHSILRREVTLVKRNAGKLLEMYIFEDLKHRIYDSE
tara:strand:- start:200 stop:457 length:258 start_codon:yes stop_codon:yes gene_type:complete